MEEINTNLKKDKDVAMLNELFRNAEMGRIALSVLIDKSTDGVFSEILSSHLKAFSDFERILGEKLREYGKKARKTGKCKTLMLTCSIKTAILLNRSTKKFADMLIQGNNMGIIDVNKVFNAYKASVSDEVGALAHELLALEQRQIDELKPWL